MFSVFLCWTVLLGAFSAAAEESKPNVVYIIVDELAYFEVGFMGNPLLQTPHLDQMAAEGIIFRNLLAGGPACAPTRACLLTGKHSGHTSVRTNFGQEPLRADEETTGSILTPLGYATGGFGKWGVGGRDSTGVPEIHGFDDFFGYYHQVHAHTYYPPYLVRNGQEVACEGNFGLPGEGATYSAYVIHEAAKQFIRDHAHEPFFAYLPYTPPHGIYQIPQDDPAWAIYKDATYDDGRLWPLEARRYAAMTTMVDRQVGEIRALLAELGIAQKTLVFFSGDNGGMDRWPDPEHPRGLFGGNKDPLSDLEYRGGKGNLYDGALRVPFVACWPGKIAPGQVSEHLGYFPDVLPTIADLTGAAVPPGVDGISFLPTLIGEAAAGHSQAQHDYLYWEYNQWKAIRQGNWKAVNNSSGVWELYNVVADPGESNNVAASHAAILNNLKALASSARTPVQEGTFTTTERSARDKAAKGGNQDTVAPVPLILQYKLDGNASDAANAGTLSHHGTLHGGSYVQSFFQPGQCVSLDGVNDYLETPLLVGTSFTSLTFSGWIFLNQLPASGTNYQVCGFSTTARQVGGFDVYVTSDGRLVFSTGYSDASPQWDLLQTEAGRISAGQWTHVAVTFAADHAASGLLTGTKTIYLNGQSQVSEPSRPYKYFHLLAEGAVIGAGRNSEQGLHSFFNGKLDDIRLYNRALSAQAIRSMATITVAPPPVDIVPDSKIDLKDLAAFADYWLHADCYSNGLCDGRDLNADQKVDMEDLKILSQQWLFESGSVLGSIGVCFRGNLSKISGTIGPDEVAGFSGYQQSNWNVAEGLSGSLAGLLDSSGSATAVSVAYSAEEVWGSGSVPNSPDGRLMTGWINGKGSSPVLVEFSSIPYLAYSVVVYSDTPGSLVRVRDIRLVDPSDGSVIAGPYYYRDTPDMGGLFFDGTYLQAPLSDINDTSLSPVGNVWIYTGLTSPNVRVELREGAGDPSTPNDRYTLNAIQIYGQ